MLKTSAWKLIVWWIVAPAVVGTLSLAVPVTIISGLPSSYFVGDNGVAPLLIFAFALVVITAPLIGLAQGLILMRSLDTADAAELWSAGGWFLATIAGVLLAIVAVGIVNASLLCGGGIILPGAVLGLAQWLVLKSYVQKAGWWILACTLAWNASMLVGWAVSTAYLSADDLSDLPYYPFRSMTYLGAISFAGMITFGVVTGLALIGLLTRRNLNRLESKG